MASKAARRSAPPLKAQPKPNQPSKKPHELQAELVADMVRLRNDPEGFIYYAFPWGEKGTPLEHKRPRKWLISVCRDIKARLDANEAKPGNEWEIVQEAVASGHGIGKSAGIAQLMLWAMSTHDMCRGVVTANTFTQLRTKTWPELVKWHQMCITRHWFTVTATSIYHVEHPENWKVDAIPWSAHNTEAFAGLHNEGKRIFIAYDEASAIDDPVWETTEGALTDAGTQIIWMCAGNPTRASGRFRQCFTRERHLWHAMNVDSRTVEGVNLARIERWARLYGEDSQFFNVRVKGQFVEADANQLIPLQWIADARMRGYSFQPDGSQARKRVSVDVADGGEDDTVITVGEHWTHMRLMRKQSAFSFQSSVAVIESGDAAMRMWDSWGCDRDRDDIVVDSLGVGAGCAGHLMMKDLPVVQYKGGESSSNPARFRNRRVQSYMALRNDMRDGLVAFAPDMLDDEDEWEELEAQLCSVKSKPGTEKLEDLMTKEEMRRAGIKSPDRADSLAMQYADQYPTVALAGDSGATFQPVIVESDFMRGYVG